MLHIGNVFDILPTFESVSVNCVVTSPPYWGLRDYGVEGQIGLEATPEEYTERMVAVFREVKRILRDDGVCWVNMGDSYNGYMANQRGTGLETKRQAARKYIEPGAGLRDCGLKQKDLVGIPWRVAFALQADGWYLRQDIIWAKPNPMPESVTDRCTKAHEYIFLLTKSARYWYDADAIAEQSVYKSGEGGNQHFGKAGGKAEIAYGQLVSGNPWQSSGSRNARSVWTITTQPFPDAHFATFPEEIPKRCILAGCPQDGVVLDPFMGSGTVAKVAQDLGRKWVGIELNPEYAEMVSHRAQQYGMAL